MKKSLNLISLALLSTSAIASIEPSHLPSNGKITQGNATITSSNNNMVINQGSDRVSIDWDSFNIGKEASVEYKQPDKISIAYNRVIGSNISTIQGKLKANGRVFLANPNGILFTKDAQVNVGAILVTTKDLEKFIDKPTTRYAQDQVTFNKKNNNNINAKIINEGNINAEEGIYLIGNNIVNKGNLNLTGKPEEFIKINSYSGNLENINSRHKTILIAATDSFTIKLDSFEITLTGGEMANLIQNEGAIISNDKVELTAKGKEQLKNGIVNNLGLIEADSISIEGKKIILGNNSDIRYGKQNSNKVKLNITQKGKDEYSGIDISGKITSLAKTDKITTKVQADNKRFGEGVFIDNDGNAFYTENNGNRYSPKWDIKKVKKEGNGFKAEDGTLYIPVEEGYIEFSASGYNNGSWTTGFNGTKYDTIRVTGTPTSIIRFNYTKENGHYSKLEIQNTGNKSLDRVNQKIVDKVKEKLNNKDYSILNQKEFEKLANAIISEEITNLINKIKISQEQLKQLTAQEKINTNSGEQEVGKGHILTSTINKINKELKKTDNSINIEDIKLLASLLDNRRTLGFGVQTQKSGYKNNGKTINLLRLNSLVAKNYQQTSILPLTTISAETAININNAQFEHTNNSQQNILILAQNSAEKAIQLNINNSDFNLGSGSIGIGRQEKPTDISYNITLVRNINGEVLPLYSLKRYNQTTHSGSIIELLNLIKLTDNADSVNLIKSDNSQISVKALWNEFIKSPNIDLSNLNNNTKFESLITPAFIKYATSKGISNTSSITGVIQHSGTTLNGRQFYSRWGGGETISLAQKTEIVKSLTTTKRPEFNLLINNSTFKNMNDLIIADGFKNIIINNVTTGDNIGLYINAGNMRTYTTQINNLSEKEKKQGFEYAIDDLKERVLRGSIPLSGNRYKLINNVGREKSKKEFDNLFGSWETSPLTARSHINDTKILVNNSNLKSKDGFIHLVANNIEIKNSHLNVDYARDLGSEAFMFQVNKIGINGKNIILDNSSLKVNGSDIYGSSAKPNAAGIFLIGNLIGKNNSSIYAKTFDGHTIRTIGDTRLSGEKSATDLKITAINSGLAAQADGASLDSAKGDYFVNTVAFYPGKAAKSDDNGNILGGSTTKLENLELNIFSPNGALAFESYGPTTNSGNINIGKNATFNYFERPRVITKNGMTVVGKANQLSLRDMLRNMDKINGIATTNLGNQQTVSQNVTSNLNITQHNVDGITTQKEAKFSTCEKNGQTTNCQTFYIGDPKGDVTVGDITEM